MKPNLLLIFSLIILCYSCNQGKALTDQDKEAVKSEIKEFLTSLDAALINPDVDKYAAHFSNSE